MLSNPIIDLQEFTTVNQLSNESFLNLKASESSENTKPKTQKKSKNGLKHKSFWRNIDDYNQEVFSVFSDSNAVNPIFNYLNAEPGNLVVADFGCGPGNFLPFLAKKFKKVIAVDYSENLLEVAKRNGQYPNIEFKELNMKNLKELHNSVDLAISVNSILPSSIREADTIISEIYASLAKGGKFVGILPAADAVSHYLLLECQRLIDEGKSEREIERQLLKVNETSVLGFHRDTQNSPRQKYLFPSEILWRFNKVGFEDITLSKVYYSWEYCKDHFYGYFPDRERIWDWFVVAKKP
jgi:SAM-dependent methyltransferase